MSAIISKDGDYRYRLERYISPAPLTLGVVMINPSTADAEKDDATIRKLKGFAQRNGCGRLIVGNLFAFRSTQVSTLQFLTDPVGPENDRHLEEIINDCREGRLIAAWGASNKIPDHCEGRVMHFVEMCAKEAVTLWCWGVTKDGSPRHPLYVPYETDLEPWSTLNAFA